MDRTGMTRRGVLGVAATAAIAGCTTSPKQGQTAKAVRHGRINQSVVQWCFAKHWEVDRTCRVAAELGCKSVELVGPETWPTLKRHGLVCAITGSHGFEKGMNNPAHHPACLDAIRKSIDASADAGFPNVITFTGFAKTEAGTVEPDAGIRNCVEGYKRIIGHAEKRGVNLCLEMLNSRVGEEMKGHPGYQGDHTDYCMEIIRQVGSPRMKLLFDIYHVQVMDGDVIRRIRECKEYIGHVHTAGNPGRRELDDRQEINYPPIMQALLDIGYTGYVGQEFIPTGDPYKGLRQAVRVCDV